MTISSQTRKAGPFNGNGTTTAFPFTFKVFAVGDVSVVRANASGVETVLTLTSDYTVSLNANQNSNPGGTVNLVSALASGSSMVITSEIDYLQPTDLTNQGGFYPSVINNSLDRLTMLSQQLKEQVDRSAKLPITSTEDANALVADLIRVSDSADNIDTVASNIADINTVAGDIADVTTVAGSIANVNAVGGDIADVSTVAGAIADVSDVADHIADIQAAVTSAANAATSAAEAASSASSASASAVTAEHWADLAAVAVRNGAHVTDFGAVGNGTTEDTVAVQAAINSGAKLIVFPAGLTFLIDQVTSAGTDTTFYAVGATIKLKANSTIYRPLRINHARCTVIGGTWDGNRANQTAGDAFGSWAIGIHADDGAVYDATIKNFRGSGVKVVGGNRCTVERCRITDIGYSTSLTCYGIYMETAGGVANYGNKARDNFIQLGNNGLADQGILFTSNSTSGGEAQWDWEISGNTVYGSTNASAGDLSINLAVRGHRGKVIGNTTTAGAMGWSEGGDYTIIENNTFIDTVGSIRWGVEASGKKMVVANNVLTGHLRGICFSFDNNDDMVIAGNTIETDGTGNHCIAVEIPVSGTGKNITIVGNMMKGRRAIIATRETKGINIVGNTFVGPGSGTSGSRFVFFDTPTTTTMFANIKANKISACERAVSVYSASATTYTDIAFTGNNCRDDIAGGVFAHVIAEGSAVMGSRIKNFDNEQNSTSDNFNLLFDNTNKRGIEYSNSYATPEGNVTAGVGSIYVNLAGSAGTVLWIKESGTGNTGWKPLGQWAVNGSDIYRSSGNVGIGAAPSAWTLKALQYANGAVWGLATDDSGVSQNAYFSSGWKYISSSVPATLYAMSSGKHSWQVAPSGTAGNAISFTQAMTLDASGNLLVGYTAKGSTTVTSHVAANAYNCKAGVGAALGGNVFNINWTGSAQLWIDALNTGTITVTSDYRIKQNVETQIAPALERVMQLRPVTYELKDYGTLFKADGVAREGFIAHELQAVIPSAVEGEKDAEDQIQSLKLDALCSVLTKAIQEQQAIITQLQADVAALKGQ